ncbi:MAG: 50S ribosomal protein L11 methyltransferase [Pyrinomonadaceae bacterium]
MRDFTTMQTKAKKLWRVVEVKASEEAVEAVEFGLNEAGACGTEVTKILGNLPSVEIVESKSLKASESEIVSIRAYFQDLTIRKAAVLPFIQRALKIYGFDEGSLIKSVKCFSIADKDWLRVWKKHWKPVETAKFIIMPSWRRGKTATSKEVIYIEPGMAFGTGTHETTQLCLKAIEQFFAPGMSFLDVGTGTGILAIAASKISPNSKIVACDIDQEAIAQAKKNAELNRTNNIEFYVGSVNDAPETSAESSSFDFVCANLTLETILPILPLLIEKSRKFLVLSGILREQRKAIEERLRKHNTSVETLGEWISIKVRFKC